MGNEERFKAVMAVFLVLRRGDEVLLMRRAGTGFCDGQYSVPTGHVDGNEPLTHAMVREAKEEVGVGIKPEDLSLEHVIHRTRFDGDGEYVNFFFTTDVWEGEPSNCEPHKCDDVKWVHVDRLPSEITYDTDSALRSMRKGERFGCHGFEE